MAVATITERAMETWAKEQRKKLPKRIRRLMAMASFDLYYGPLDIGYTEETGYGSKTNTRWPGFTKACNQIRKALDALNIGDVWVDTQTEEVMEREPQGFYLDNPEYDPTDPDSEEEEWIEPCWEDIVHVDRQAALGDIVGDNELTNHVT